MEIITIIVVKNELKKIIEVCSKKLLVIQKSATITMTMIVNSYKWDDYNESNIILLTMRYLDEQPIWNFSSL